MTKTALQRKILSYSDWEFWAERPFGAFLLSLWKDGNTRAYMKKAGVGAAWPAMLFQDGAWYKSQKVWSDFAGQLEKYLRSGHTVFEVTASCEKFYKLNKPKIVALSQGKKDVITRLQELYEILTQISSYVWLAHGFEEVYVHRLRTEVPKYVPGDAEKFIGDVSFPIKKNAHVLMEEALRKNKPIEQVVREFAWIKIRDGFSAGFTVAEMRKEKQKALHSPAAHWKRPNVPSQLRDLVKVAQELVYFRTLRTDILYEFLYLARPLLKKVAAHYHIQFEDLRNYAVQDLLAGTPKVYPPKVTAVSYRAAFGFFDTSIIRAQQHNQTSVKGTVAFAGLVTGRVKIVKVAHEIGKVKTGDILVAPTTAPSFILGMKKAAGFVTDEGGITSHAAIVSREMKKPCIIGTKIATKIFRDGDRVEVNAHTGIVKKI